VRHSGYMDLLHWPKTRPIRDAATGRRWTAVIEPGRLEIVAAEDNCGVVTVSDAHELRALAFALYAAAIEQDLAERYPPGQGRAAAKAARRRAAERRHPRASQKPLHLFRDPR
jgi:hypothetical protein